jgi:queuine tRNA-ribosyltransferase
LHHLAKTGEALGAQLLGQHNLYFYHRLMRDLRASILADRFLDLYREKRELLGAADVDHPTIRPQPVDTSHRTLGDFEVHTAWEGFASIRQISSGEIMHSRTAPMEEARGLYVEQSNLAERVRLSVNEDASDAAPLVLWDVGLGAAANAMAAIDCYEREAAAGPVRALQLVSFENDLDALRLALRLQHEFTYLRHAAPASVLTTGRWQSRLHTGLSWVLLDGDFPATMRSAPAAPDLIYYDMFSSKHSGDPWTLDTFRGILEACSGRATELYTYTCSTANRAALLAAGFYVAKGQSAGAKTETTIALTPAAFRAPSGSRHEMLAADWLGNWTRSAAQFPAEMSADERPEFERVIRGHLQFQNV